MGILVPRKPIIIFCLLLNHPFELDRLHFGESRVIEIVGYAWLDAYRVMQGPNVCFPVLLFLLTQSLSHSVTLLPALPSSDTILSTQLTSKRRMAIFACRPQRRWKQGELTIFCPYAI